MFMRFKKKKKKITLTNTKQDGEMFSEGVVQGDIH